MLPSPRSAPSRHRFSQVQASPLYVPVSLVATRDASCCSFPDAGALVASCPWKGQKATKTKAGNVAFDPYELQKKHEVSGSGYFNGNVLHASTDRGTSRSSFTLPARPAWRWHPFFRQRPRGCCVGRAWRGRAAAGGHVALWRAVLKRGILKQAEL